MNISSSQYFNENENHCSYSQSQTFDEFDAAVEAVLGDVDPLSLVQTIDLDQLMTLEPPLECSMIQSAYQFPQITENVCHQSLMNSAYQFPQLSQNMCPPSVMNDTTEIWAQNLKVSIDIDENSIEELPKPKRALSAYNMFFQSERKRILKSLPKDLVPCAGRNRKGKKKSHPNAVSFADMARLVASRWKTISKEERMEYDYLAAIDGERYEKEMEQWKRNSKA